MFLNFNFDLLLWISYVHQFLISVYKAFSIMHYLNVDVVPHSTNEC